MKYIIQERESKTFVEAVDTLEEAKEAVKEYEQMDSAEENFVPNFYEIIEADE